MNWFTRWLNTYTRKIGKIINVILVLSIFALYGLEISEIINILVSYELIFFIALNINNLLFLIYAISLNNEFNEQIQIYHNRGIPLDSTEGFQYSRTAVDNSVNRSLTLNMLIVIGTILHFIPNMSNSLDSLTFQFLSYFGIGLVLIGMSLFLQIDYPDHSLLEPGNFISYHEPKSTPTFLDNLLADSLKSFLDPRTSFQLDNWMLDIENKLNPSFELDEVQEIRVERAIERIILLLYLKQKVPYLVTEEIVIDHLDKIIRPELKDEFIAGTASELPLDIFTQLIKKMTDDIPEIFKLVDRLLVEVMVNPTMFEKKDKIIETVIPDDDALDVKESFRVLIFVLNLARHSNKRIVEVIAETSRHIEPPLSKVKFQLDDPDNRILDLIRSQERENGDLIYSERIIEILSTILQVGDTTWLQFIPQEYGKHVLNLAVTENEFQTYGSSVPIDVQFSITNSLKKIFSSLSGIGGAIYPVIKALLINPLF